jgi:UDP-N-acetylglucosamine--N-acetylmuramyl-(pentapeptide) pyrophosphoryl-undecaprenol N-acetylglucosamine transferase
LKLRVYVAPCGIGLGHITRSVPIADELKRRGNEIAFSTYLDGLDFARQNHLPTYEAVPINFKVTSDGSIDFKMTAATSGFSLGVRTFLRQVTREIKFMRSFRPDIVFSDSRASSLIAARLLRIPVVLMLNQFRVEIVRRPTGRRISLFDRLFFFIANLGWLFIRTALALVWVRSQIILIPDLPSPNTISLGNLAIPRRYDAKVRLIGPIVNDNVEITRSEGELKRRLGFHVTRPLVYAAVSGPKVEREILANLLLQSLHGFSKKYDVVLSQGNPNGQRKPHRVRNVIAYDWIENQDDFIKACDVVVSRAGHGTIMKSLVYGKPMILIPIPDHTEQYGNANRAATLGVAKIMDQSMLDHETLEDAIQEILGNADYRDRSIELMKTTRRMHAIGSACEAISSLAASH